MPKLNLLVLILVANISSGQEKYREAEGFYDLSGFEITSGMYLLENQNFIYFASFGNADLRAYGTYSISDTNELSLQVNGELLKEFLFYGLHNGMDNGKIVLHYKMPYEEKVQNLFVVTDQGQQTFPEFTPENDMVSMTLEWSGPRTIQIGYEDYEENRHLTELELDNGINEIRIHHNYYSDMAAEVSRISFHIDKGILTKNDTSESKSIPKMEINKKTANEINDFITGEENRTSLTIDEKTYQKL